MAETLAHGPIQAERPGETRRDFLYLTAVAMTAVGTAVAIWPLIDSMNPSAEVRALATLEIDLAPIQLGQRVTVIWRSQPVFIDRRTPERIAQAKADDTAELRDPEPDSARVQRDEWLIVIGVCTHLGCIPKGQKSGDPLGKCLPRLPLRHLRAHPHGAGAQEPLSAAVRIPR
jgi:ubiquinol-cytochrome c reductase iron-sulfur subunit